MTEYPARIARLVESLGSLRAVELALGVPRGTLQYRIDRPAMVRREHVLAAEMLERSLETGTAPPTSYGTTGGTHTCTCLMDAEAIKISRMCPVHGGPETRKMGGRG